MIIHDTFPILFLILLVSLYRRAGNHLVAEAAQPRLHFVQRWRGGGSQRWKQLGIVTFQVEIWMILVQFPDVYSMYRNEI